MKAPDYPSRLQFEYYYSLSFDNYDSPFFLVTGKTTAVHETKEQFKFTHCTGRNILHSVQIICKFS